MLIRKGREDVTVKEAFEYLGQIRKVEREMKRLELAIQQASFSLLPGAIRYDKEKVQTSPDDMLTKTFAEIDEMERELKANYKKKAEFLNEIYRTIEERMPEDTEVHQIEKNVVVMYFVGRKTIREISAEMNYSVPHIYRLRNNGVRMFAEVMSDDKRS